MECGRPVVAGGIKLPTIKDVARLVGVAPSTVSRVLAGSDRISAATRQRVEAAMKAINYHPNAIARSLACRSTFTVGLVIARSAEEAFANPFFPEVIRGIGTVLETEGYNLLLSPANGTAGARNLCLRILRQRQVDGVILTGHYTGDRLVAELVAERYPAVLIGSAPDQVTLSWVDTDNIAVGAMAVEHLVGRGYRRIALINGPAAARVCVDRQEGYGSTLRRAGLPVYQAYQRNGAFTREGGHRAMAELLAFPEPPDAVFATDDAMAIGAMLYLRDQGVPVGPGGIAVVGVNDDPLVSLLSPPLTTVRIPILDLGFTAARMLIDQIGRRDGGPRRVILPSILMVRAST